MSTRQPRNKSLLDAIADACVAVTTAREGEAVDSVTIAEHPEGGWVWGISLVSRRSLGNVPAPATDTRPSLREENMRQVLTVAMEAQMRAAAARVDGR